MYGSLTTIVLIMLWLYFCMYCVLFGAQLNIYMKDVSLPEQIKRKLLKRRQILQKELRKQLQKQIQKRKNRLDN